MPDSICPSLHSKSQVIFITERTGISRMHPVQQFASTNLSNAFKKPASDGSGLPSKVNTLDLEEYDDKPFKLGYYDTVYKCILNEAKQLKNCYPFLDKAGSTRGSVATCDLETDPIKTPSIYFQTLQNPIQPENVRFDLPFIARRSRVIFITCEDRISGCIQCNYSHRRIYRMHFRNRFRWQWCVVGHRGRTRK
ncbi:hypothetical protein CEXT_119221 [Caerostris extrusa]|uniref:Uncharacterized protein n=1 Tax=Caerostris extrusa TaxID=172846 RepID=A0AAV4TJV7_CAEEX|nr:hypothetical protein CEXT_119221 [Caerostris extrusa]